MLADDLRQQLIRQFPAEVVETKGQMKEMYYSCPTCGRPVSLGTEQCSGCDQILSWKNIKEEEAAKGLKSVTLRFEVPVDFTVGDCRKCPVSYIGKQGNESVYECPLKMRGSCKLELS